MGINDSQKNNSEDTISSSGNEIAPNKSMVKRSSTSSRLYFSSSDPTDGRKRWEWETRYPAQAILEIRWEAIYLFALLIFSLFFIFATWKGWVSYYLAVPLERATTLNPYLYYALSGILGGVTFDMKYLYRTVARGWWHQDRRIWRLMSPFIAMSVALIVGAMIDASLITTQIPLSGAASVSIGFLTGYFADHAVGKMYEIAMVIFGRSAAIKGGDEK